MTALISATWVSRWLQSLPAPLLASLDAWSHRVAQRRAQERRKRALRPAGALPPVITGRAYLPHPWRD